ncbi:hypothetical protein NXS19_013262 [Fusarium pseudograminearum]|nr:hypothetical protein NXS19_013262 [Fusarium pseudograminearum]
MPPVHGSSPAVTSTSEHFYTQAEGAKRNGWVLYQPPSRTIEILCNSPFIAPSFGGYPLRGIHDNSSRSAAIHSTSTSRNHERFFLFVQSRCLSCSPA